MLNIGIRAARIAGDIIVREVDRIDTLRVESKNKYDYVTEVDQTAEDQIIYTIKSSYPEHSFLCEESGEQGKSDYCWIIDPLDGTTNFLNGLPHFSVSIALKYKDKLEQAIIYDPLRQELFTATRGCGAVLNERRIRVSKKLSLQGALLGTGFPYREEQNFEEFISRLRAIVPDTAGIRRAGSAALDLAYVACGRLDGFWECGLKPWDVAAGALLIQESGGMSTDFEGSDSYLETGNIVTANPRILKEMLAAFKQ